MEKIKTLFVRDPNNPKFVTREVDSECQWVADGEGVATAKWDGTACLVHEGRLYRRHQLRTGRPKPTGWLHWTLDPELKSGHGWLPVGKGPADDYHREAYNRPMEDGTYELCGPKVNRNPHRFEYHTLVRHGEIRAEDAPRSYDELAVWLKGLPFEGLVWHCEDGRMAKIKRRDFGIPWPLL